MNIFETIHKVSDRDEPYHSQFLADALQESQSGDRSLFEAVWKLAAPDNWEPPTLAEITSEERFEDGSRIDICIRSDEHLRIVGIEVKTVDASAKSGQLQRYKAELQRRYDGYGVQVSYLTPFSEREAGDSADRLPTVRVFREFKKDSPGARHLSWRDIAAIDWDGNALWKQHQEYVASHIAPNFPTTDLPRNRELIDFFGEVQTEGFREALSNSDIHLNAGTTYINLADFENDLSSFTSNLVRALRALLTGRDVMSAVEKDDAFPDELRPEYLNSRYGEVHATLFGLAKRFGHVWIEGKGNYGVRTAYRGQSNGLSLITSRGIDCLVVGRRR